MRKVQVAQRGSQIRRLGSAFCSELRGSPLQVPHHSRVKMVVVGFLRQGTLDCPPLPLGLCVACRGNRSSPRGGQECELSSKLRRGLAVEGWRVELTPQITGVEALGVYMVSKVSWGDRGPTRAEPGVWWAGGDPWGLPELGVCKAGCVLGCGCWGADSQVGRDPPQSRAAHLGPAQHPEAP